MAIEVMSSGSSTFLSEYPIRVLFGSPGLFQGGFISTKVMRLEGELPGYETKKEVALWFPIVRGNGRSGMGPGGRCRGSEKQFS
jgi:hypothetical protein